MKTSRVSIRILRVSLLLPDVMQGSASADERDQCHRRSLGEGCQLRSVIGDEDHKHARRLCRARILAHKMLASGRLEEGLAGLVDLRRPGRRVLERIAPETTTSTGERDPSVEVRSLLAYRGSPVAAT